MDRHDWNSLMILEITQSLQQDLGTINGERRNDDGSMPTDSPCDSACKFLHACRHIVMHSITVRRLNDDGIRICWRVWLHKEWMRRASEISAENDRALVCALFRESQNGGAKNVAARFELGMCPRPELKLFMEWSRHEHCDGRFCIIDFEFATLLPGFDSPSNGPDASTAPA